MKPEFIIVAGLERLPAILTRGSTLKQLGLESYEICSCEPQEDLFTLTLRVLTELPSLISNDNLRLSVKRFRDFALGRHLKLSYNQLRLLTA